MASAAASPEAHPAGHDWADWVREIEVTERRKGGERPIDLLFWIGGELSEVEEALGHTFRALAGVTDLAHIILLLDGPQVKAWAPVDYYAPLLPSVTEIAAPSRLDLPAALYTAGLFASKSAWVGFIWPGVTPSAQGLNALLTQAGEEPLVYGLLPDADVARPEVRLDSWRIVQREGRYAYPPELQHPPMAHGWLQMMDGVPMANALLAARARDDIGGFDHRAALQAHFWWDYVRRLSRSYHVRGVEVEPPAVQWAWSDYPFVDRVWADPDLVFRLMSDESRRIADADQQAQVRPDDVAHLSADLALAYCQRLQCRVDLWTERHGIKASRPRAAKMPRPEAPGRWPLRVTVLGGVYEPHHAQICFYSFFERLVEQGYLTWRSVLDRYALPADLGASDLVIFIRPRAEETKAALDHCVRARVPTLAMFDDNWLTMAQDRPIHRAQFSPGQPDYENFLYACRTADLTVTYNEHMAEDLRPHCRRLVCLPPPIDMAAFEAGQSARPEGELLIAYAGAGLREGRNAFRALSRFVAERENARVLVNARVVPEEFAELPADRIKFVPYEYNFFSYAQRLAKERPDLMLAPLGATCFDLSKCPRKFLDAAAAGSPGIFSDVETYRPYIRHGQTGLLVEDTEHAWHEAMVMLGDNADLRREIAQAAREDVRARFSNEVLMPDFLQLLQQAISLSAERSR